MKTLFNSLLITTLVMALIFPLSAKARTPSSSDAPKTFTESKTLAGGIFLEFSMVTLARYKNDIQKVFDYTFSEIGRISQMFSSANSEIQTIEASRGQFVQVSKEFLVLAKLAYKIADWSKGYYSPVRGASYKNLKINEKKSSVKLKNGNLDFSGILEGFIADLCIRAAYHANVDDAFVRVNGVVRSMGREVNWPWQITVTGRSEKFAKSGITINIANFSAATVGGQYAAPTVDPTNQKPFEQEFYSVTILTSQAAMAQGVANAVFVMGHNAGIDLIHDLGIRGIFAYGDGRIERVGKWQ